METAEEKLISEFNEKVLSIFKDFMARVTEFEELMAVGSRFLVGFHQELQFLRQHPIDKTSELVKKIIDVNETKRLQSYFLAGCRNTHDGVNNISKYKPLSQLKLDLRNGGMQSTEVNTCHVGLHDCLTKGKSILRQQESLLENVISTLRTAGEDLPPFWEFFFADRTTNAATTDDGEIASSGPDEDEVSDFALLMGIIYSMLKQDYEMQERIVSSLNLKSSSGELESYCLLWSLHPYVNDDIMHQAWKLIP